MKAASTVCINIPEGLPGEDAIKYFMDALDSINGNILSDMEFEELG